MPDAEHRQRLAAMQARLVTALMRPSEMSPTAFDADRLRLAASMLRQKRRKTLAYLLPALARHLGDNFEEQFALYVEESPGPPADGTLADAISFARFVVGRRALPMDAAREVLRMRLTVERLAWLRLSDRPCLLIGIRLFRRRVRFIRVPCPRKDGITSGDSRTP